MDNMESLLHHALTPTEGDAPDPRLKQKIMQSYQEVIPMKQKTIKRPALAILASAAIIASGSLTAVAAWHYLNPAQVAQEARDDSLAEAFQGKDAVSINETQTYGGYKVTLHGMVSGKAISSNNLETDGELQDSRTYAVLSIENKDGSPLSARDNISEIDSKIFFTVSPFIQGQRTDRVNITTMNGGIYTFMKEGIMYKLADCDSLEAFADRKVYLGITDTLDIDNSAFEMNRETGKISRVENYAGLNALFTLPLDQKKADKKKADEQLKAWLKPITSNNTEISIGTDSRTSSDIAKEISDWTAKKVREKCVCLEEYTKNAKPDREGCIQFSWEHEGIGGAGTFSVEDSFKYKKAGTSLVLGNTVEEVTGKIYFDVATKEQDGSFTFRLYYADVADVK